MPTDVESEISRTRGGPIPLAGENGNYVIMTIDQFRDLAGVTEDSDLRASVSNLKTSLEHANKGQTVSLPGVALKLQEKHGISSRGHAASV